MDGYRTRIVAVAILTAGGLVGGWQRSAQADVVTYANSPMVGMNVPGMSNQSTASMLSNLYLSAGGWNYFPQGSPTGGYDSQGNPILSSGQSAGQNIYLQNDNNSYDLGGALDNVDYPAGVYTVTWTGTGSISLGEDDVDNNGNGDNWTSYGNESTTHSQTFTVAPGTTTGGGGLYMFDSYASNGTYNSTSNPVSNIHVYAPGYAPGQTNAGLLFTKPFTQGLRPFGTLRFMDAMNTNGDTTAWTSLSTSTYPGPQVSDNTWNTSAGMPIAAMVSLANSTHTNPWFCMPANATDAYIKQFASYVQANLDPTLKVYIEYGNEDWSGNNPAGQRIKSQSGGAGNGPTFDANWASDAEAAFKDWESVYTGSASGVSTQLVRVAALQTSNSYDSPMFLSSLHSAGGFDAVADAPYFGPTSANIASYSALTTSTQILNDMIANIKAEAAGDWSLNKQWANQYGVPLIGYEGGQGLAPDASPGSTAWYNAYIAAEESPEMEAIFQLWLQTYLDQVGASEVNAFSYIGQPGEYGAWGTMEYAAQPNAPKYNGMVDFLTGVPEPATMSLLIPAGLLLLPRRRAEQAS